MTDVRVNIIGWRERKTPVEAFDELIHMNWIYIWLCMLGDKAVEAVGRNLGKQGLFRLQLFLDIVKEGEELLEEGEIHEQ